METIEIEETEEQLAPLGGTALESANMLHEWADMVIQNVQSQSDQKLIELARDAQNLEKAAFRVRGACGAELKRRLRERHPADGVEAGEKQIGKEMGALAKEMGVAPKTLEDDTRIFETFSDNLRGNVDLDREHFRVALSAPDPQAAIDLAYEQRRENESYSTRDFRDDVKRLRGDDFRARGGGRGLSVRLDQEAAELLQDLSEMSAFDGESHSAIVLHALMALRDAVRGRL